MNEEFINSIGIHTAYDFSHLKDQKYVIFWGGTDVNPALYGEKPSQYTQRPDSRRDILEIAIAKYCRTHKIPMIGICRGAQLLNVFNGGKLLQDITNHIGAHIMRTYDGREILVNSTHHQMMVPAKHADILGTAHHPSKGLVDDKHVDLSYTFEVLAYPETKTLCIQYHPEWMEDNSDGVQFAKEMACEYLGLKQVIFSDNSQWYGDI